MSEKIIFKFEHAAPITMNGSRVGGTVIAHIPFFYGYTPELMEATRRNYEAAKMKLPETRQVNFCSSYSNPTANCQIFSVAGFNNGLIGLHIPQRGNFSSVASWKAVFDKADLTNFPGLIHELRILGGSKRMMLIDMHRQWDVVIKALFGVKIMSSTEYTSTLGTFMTLYLINVDSF